MPDLIVAENSDAGKASPDAPAAWAAYQANPTSANFDDVCAAEQTRQHPVLIVRIFDECYIPGTAASEWKSTTIPTEAVVSTFLRKYGLTRVDVLSMTHTISVVDGRATHHIALLLEVPAALADRIESEGR